MKLFLVVLSLILVSCNGQKNASMKNDDSNTKIWQDSSNLVLLLQETDSSFDAAETMVIKDAKRLGNFYSKINMTRKPGIPVPVIDFSKEMVIVQCLGSQEQSGLLVLSMLNETDSEIILNYSLEKNESAVSNSSISSPYCVYKLPWSQKQVVIESNIK